MAGGAGGEKHAPKSQNNPNSCAHGRLVDEQRSSDGTPTGKLICKECGRVFSPSSLKSSR